MQEKVLAKRACKYDYKPQPMTRFDSLSIPFRFLPFNNLELNYNLIWPILGQLTQPYLHVAPFNVNLRTESQTLYLRNKHK